MTMFRTITVAALATVLAATLSACNDDKTGRETDNSFATVGDVRGGSGMKGASYVECVSPSGTFNVYVPPEKSHTFAAGQMCPDGKRW